MFNDIDDCKILPTVSNCGLELQRACHKASKDAGWWIEQQGYSDLGEELFVPLEVVPTKLCLIHSEISEAMEAHRKDLMDDKLPHRKGIEVELADAVIRIMDLAGALDLDIGGAIAEKMAYNAQREDHKPESRAKPGGKKY